MNAFVDLNETNINMDTSLDLEGKLLNENYGKDVPDTYDINEICKPLGN